jgi:probable F420-dependent oxidoreductase
MKIDAIVAADLADAASAAASAEDLGCDGIMVPEVAHDPFLPLALAAASTTRIRLQTGIAVAFARNPMTVAVTASDLHRLSGGRFALGLGSQVKAHITRRFSMQWSSPAARMREFVRAVQAIWKAWDDQAPLDFRGDFYQHTLMTPMFSHGPSPCGWPSIQIAAVGPVMTAVAGEVADGLLCHGFTTADYVRDVTLPQLQSGAGRAGRSRSDLEVSLPVMLVLTDDERDPKIAAMKSQIAFYGSTPAYRPVLDHHGWSALGEELHAMSRRGEWEKMGGLIEDNVLHAFAVVDAPREAAAQIRARFGGLVDRLQVAINGDKAHFAELFDALQDDRPAGTRPMVRPSQVDSGATNCP